VKKSYKREKKMKSPSIQAKGSAPEVSHTKKKKKKRKRNSKRRLTTRNDKTLQKSNADIAQDDKQMAKVKMAT
jgi:hypothetical protein